jgi:hypothetical protein
MQVAARARLFLARHPRVYWLAVVVLATGVAVGVQRQLDEVDDARQRWSTVRAVAVAAHDHQPGDALSTRMIELPPAAIPATALEQPPSDARALQRIGTGEVVVAADVMPGTGPAAGAQPGTLVVPIVDPLARDVRIGLGVQIVAEGIVLATRATVVEVIDEVVFVAVDPHDAPLVAAAARRDTASLLYVP